MSVAPKTTEAQRLRTHGVRTRGRVRHKSGQMNKTEARFLREWIQPAVACGDILHWQFEAIKLRLAPRCFYDTDFFTVSQSGAVRVYEVKGFMEDDAAVKLRVVAEKYPFEFYLCTLVKGEWCVREVGVEW